MEGKLRLFGKVLLIWLEGCSELTLEDWFETKLAIMIESCSEIIFVFDIYLSYRHSYKYESLKGIDITIKSYNT